MEPVPRYLRGGVRDLHKEFARAKAREALFGGRLEERAELVVRAFEARNVRLSDDARARILGCRAADELARWFDRALVVAAVADLFADADED